MAKRGKYLVGVDLGGTKIFTTLVTKKGKLLAETKKRTRADEGPEAVIGRIADSVNEVIDAADVKRRKVRAVGVGAPGPLNPDTGIILHAPNLPGWDHVPLAKILEKRLGLPVFIENDVNAGTYGEYKLGAGQGKKDIIGIFVGTGIGGGIIEGGKLRSGYRHAAAEVGHMVIQVDGPECGCGRRGCLESLASRTAMERDIEAELAAGRESVLPELVAKKGRMTSGVLAKAVAADDALTTEIFERVERYIGIFVGSLVNFYDPEMVILGGGVVEALGETFMEPVRETAREYYIAQQDAEKIEIVPAQLGDYAASFGAAMLAKRRAKKKK